MEPGVYFTILICSVGMLDLVWRAASHVGKWTGKSQQLPMHDKSNRNKRDDWYMFFHRSDLTGDTEPIEQNKTKRDSRPSSISTKRRNMPRRPVVRAKLY